MAEGKLAQSSVLIGTIHQGKLHKVEHILQKNSLMGSTIWVQGETILNDGMKCASKSVKETRRADMRDKKVPKQSWCNVPVEKGLHSEKE